MVAFSRLPVACQLALFKQLPPEDQLRFRSVCRKWDRLIRVAASTRRSLIIFLADTYSPDVTDIEELQPPTTMYKPAMRLLKKEDGTPLFPRVHITTWNCLNIASKLPESVCHRIASTFTGVSTLRIIIDNVNLKHLKMVAILLQLWRRQITSFHLNECFTAKLASLTPLPATITRPLFMAINSLSSLKRLTLNLILLPLGDLPVIAHLEFLDIINLFDRRQHFTVVENLQKYGHSNRNLLQLGYSYFDGEYTLEHFTSLSSHLRQAFTRLEVLNSFSRDLATVYNHFPNLTTLRVSYSLDDDIGLVPLFEELSKLKKLIYLSLDMPIYYRRYKDDHRRLPQLPSVKALLLWPHLRTPQHMAVLDIGWLFPNLQVIQFELFLGHNFFGCGLEYGAIDANPEFVKECLRQIFHPLKRRFGDKLTILHSLTDFFHDICSTEELLAKM